MACSKNKSCNCGCSKTPYGGHPKPPLTYNYGGYRQMAVGGLSGSQNMDYVSQYNSTNPYDYGYGNFESKAIDPREGTTNEEFKDVLRTGVQLVVDPIIGAVTTVGNAYGAGAATGQLSQLGEGLKLGERDKKELANRRKLGAVGNMAGSAAAGILVSTVGGNPVGGITSGISSISGQLNRFGTNEEERNKLKAIGQGIGTAAGLIGSGLNAISTPTMGPATDSVVPDMEIPGQINISQDGILSSKKGGNLYRTSDNKFMDGNEEISKEEFLKRVNLYYKGGSIKKQIGGSLLRDEGKLRVPAFEEGRKRATEFINSKLKPETLANGGYSKTGYLPDSPDRFNPSNKINSNIITMGGPEPEKVVPFPVYGRDALGNETIMVPGETYVFEQGPVTEIPLGSYIAQNGGSFIKYQQAGPVTKEEEKAYNEEYNRKYREYQDYVQKIEKEKQRVESVRDKIISEAKKLDKADDNLSEPAYSYFLKIQSAKNPQELNKLIREAPEELKSVLPGRGSYNIAKWDKDLKNWNSQLDPARELYCTPYGCFTYQKAGASDVPIIPGNYGFVEGVNKGTLPFKEVSPKESTSGDIAIIYGLAPQDYSDPNAKIVMRPYHTTILNQLGIDEKGNVFGMEAYNANNGRRLNYQLDEFTAGGDEKENYKFFRYVGQTPQYEQEYLNTYNWLRDNPALKMETLKADLPKAKIQNTKNTNIEGIPMLLSSLRNAPINNKKYQNAEPIKRENLTKDIMQMPPAYMAAQPMTAGINMTGLKGTEQDVKNTLKEAQQLSKNVDISLTDALKSISEMRTKKINKSLQDKFDVEAFKKGVSYTESLNGELMINPYSSATGLYGQLYNEIKDLPELKNVSREQFAEDLELQNKILAKRLAGEIPNVPGIEQGAIDLFKKYSAEIENFPYTATEVGALINFIGRQGTRNYLGYVLRDKKSLAEALPKLYGAGVKTPNKTPEEYIEKFRSTYEEKAYGGGLRRWFKEEWKDIRTGEPCGRSSAKGDSDRPYPYCRPSKRVNKDTPKTSGEMTSEEKRKKIKEKASKPNSGKAPTRVTPLTRKK